MLISKILKRYVFTLKKFYGESNVKECTNLYFIHVRVCHYERVCWFQDL